MTIVFYEFHVISTKKKQRILPSDRQIFNYSTLIIYSPVATIRTTGFNFQQFYVLPTHCIYVFCVDLRTNSDYFPIQQ